MYYFTINENERKNKKILDRKAESISPNLVSS